MGPLGGNIRNRQPWGGGAGLFLGDAGGRAGLCAASAYLDPIESICAGRRASGLRPFENQMAEKKEQEMARALPEPAASAPNFHPRLPIFPRGALLSAAAPSPGRAERGPALPSLVWGAGKPHGQCRKALMELDPSGLAHGAGRPLGLSLKAWL